MQCALADFDLDSHPDYAVFTPNNNQTLLAYLSGPTVVGAATARHFHPIGNSWRAVDFNGDGSPDFLLYKADTGQTAILYLQNNILSGAALGPTIPPGWTLLAQ